MKAEITRGDAVQIMRGMADASIELVLTDPPFSSGTRREASKGIRKSMTREPFRRDCGNVIQCPPIRNGLHPTEKPVDLIRELLTVLTTEGDTVLDCFAGSGATAEACVIERRNFAGIEREEIYCGMTSARIQRARGLPCDIPRHVRGGQPLPLFGGEA